MFGDQFRQASYPGNDQPPEIRSCHTAVLGVIRSLKIVKREQGTYWKICHSCFWKYELHFLPFNSSWKEFKVLQSLQEIETYASPVSDPILNSAPSVMVVCCDKRLFDWCIVFGNEAPLFHRTGQFLLHGFFFFCQICWNLCSLSLAILKRLVLICGIFLALHLKNALLCVLF